MISNLLSQNKQIIIIIILLIMKNYILFIALTLCSLYALTNININSNLNKVSVFEQWRTQYGKQYTAFEYFYRQKIFLNTLAEIQAHNAREKAGMETYKQGLNSFSDLTDQQFAEFYLERERVKQTNFSCSDTQPPSTDVPNSFDWQAKSAVNAIRTQSKCVSGYAISTVESMEANYYITLHEKMELSAQQLIDCSKAYGVNQGCKGGSPVSSFEYIKQKGIANQTTYPYKDSDQNCEYSINKKVWQLLGCVKVTPEKITAIKAAVYKNPLAVSINSGPLKNYKSGVYKSTFTSPCKTKPDHWMLMVGYGTDSDSKKDFWKLKNSWGASWGMQGYLYIVRQKDGAGQCGVQEEMYYAR